MNFIKKSFVFLASLLIFAAGAFAVPGMVQYLPDSSGEYVYYLDKTFSRTSYLGFLYYNDSTYALRYYAPVDTVEKLPAKDITLYFSLNPDSNFLDLTGENIVGATSQDDTDIINYMHDIFYEFSARAAKAYLDSNEIIESRQDFEQFGGKVTLVFNPQVPIFNLEAIKVADGTKVFTVATTGKLTSSADKSFTNYKGQSSPKDKNRSFKKKSGAKNMDVTYGKQKIKLTTQWEKKIENLWVMDDYAILTLSNIDMPQGFTNTMFEDYMVRMFSESTTDSYIQWPMKKVERTKNVVKITSTYYQPETGDVTRDFKILTKTKDGNYAYLNLTVFDGIYQKNKGIFNSILKSYKAE